jgi:hypothetical protein
MRILSLALALGLSGCSGNSPAEVDADPRGPTCTKQPYDLCGTEHDCTSGNCRPFPAEGFQVCTQSCTPGDNTSCPQPMTGMAVCDATTSLCKPAAPNHCHL